MNIFRRQISELEKLKSDSEDDRRTFCVAESAKGMEQLGMCLPVIPALQILPPRPYKVNKKNDFWLSFPNI
jgi:hypothetical protein